MFKDRASFILETSRKSLKSHNDHNVKVRFRVRTLRTGFVIENDLIAKLRLKRQDERERYISGISNVTKVYVEDTQQFIKCIQICSSNILTSRVTHMGKTLSLAYTNLENQQAFNSAKELFKRKRLILSLRNKSLGKDIVRSQLRYYVKTCSVFRTFFNSIDNYRSVKLKKKYFLKFAKYLYLRLKANPQFYDKICRRKLFLVKYNSYIKSNFVKTERNLQVLYFLLWVQRVQISFVFQALLDIKSLKSLSIYMSKWRGEQKTTTYKLHMQTRAEVVVSRLWKFHLNSVSYKINKILQVLMQRKRVLLKKSSLRCFLQDQENRCWRRFDSEREHVRRDYSKRGCYDMLFYMTPEIQHNAQDEKIFLSSTYLSLKDDIVLPNLLIKYFRIYLNRTYICGFQQVWFDFEKKNLVFGEIQGTTGSSIEEVELNKDFKAIRLQSSLAHFDFSNRERLVAVEVGINKVIRTIKFETNKRVSETFSLFPVNNCNLVRVTWKNESTSLHPFQPEIVQLYFSSFGYADNELCCLRSMRVVFRKTMKENIFSEYYYFQFNKTLKSSVLNFTSKEDANIRADNTIFTHSNESSCLKAVPCNLRELQVVMNNTGNYERQNEIDDLLALREISVSKHLAQARMYALKSYYAKSKSNKATKICVQKFAEKYYPCLKLNIIKGIYTWLLRSHTQLFLSNDSEKKKLIYLEIQRENNYNK